LKNIDITKKSRVFLDFFVWALLNEVFFEKVYNFSKGGILSKSKLPEKVKVFVDKHCQMTTDTDSYDFSPGDGDLFQYLAKWRVLYDGLARTKLEDAILNLVSQSDLATKVAALRQSVPGSKPERIIADNLVSLLKTRYYEKQGVTKDDIALLKPIFVDNTRATMVLDQLSGQLFSEWPEGRERNLEIDRHRVDLRRGKRRKSRAFALFGWLVSYPADLEDDYSWPIRSYLMDLVKGERTRPRFGEMFKMWQLSGRYPELSESLVSAMADEVVAIPSAEPKQVPRWFVDLLGKAEELPYHLRSAVADKAENIKMYLDFEAGILEPVVKDDGTKILEPSELPARIRLERQADLEFPPNPKPASKEVRQPSLWFYFGRELLSSINGFLANIGSIKPASRVSQVQV
jgi:hypothetical protein